MTKEIDEQGEWEVIKKAHCKIRLLVKPSQSFLDWQATNPVVELEPPRDLIAEIDEIKAENIALRATLKGKGILS